MTSTWLTNRQGDCETYTNISGFQFKVKWEKEKKVYTGKDLGEALGGGLAEAEAKDTCDKSPCPSTHGSLQAAHHPVLITGP